MIFCRHEWKMLSETFTKSIFEASIEVLGGSSEVNLPHQLCSGDKKHIQVFCCNKCGKLKRFVEDI